MLSPLLKKYLYTFLSLIGNKDLPRHRGRRVMPGYQGRKSN